MPACWTALAVTHEARGHQHSPAGRTGDSWAIHATVPHYSTAALPDPDHLGGARNGTR